MFSWKSDNIYRLSHFVTHLDPPDYSQCLNNFQRAKYDSVLAVTCHATGNPNPDVTCQLWDENNAVLASEGRYCYVLCICCYKPLVSNNQPYLIFLSVSTLIGEVF